MKKKIIGIFLCIVMILTAFYNPIMTEANNETDTHFTKEEVEAYKASAENPYPEQTGSVFAGWYKDAAYNNPVTDTVPTDGAYAKFVDEEVLTFKGQLSANVTVNSKDTRLRMITAVDSDMYQKVGFKLQKGELSADLTSTTVYRTLYAYVDSEQKSYTADDVFGTQAKYFMTIAIGNIPYSDFDESFTVIPYWVTLDGTTVTGTSKTFIINDVIPVGLDLTLNCDSTTAATEDNLYIEVSENLPTQLIINGDEENAKELTLSASELKDGYFCAKLDITDIINELKIGVNKFTVRVTKEVATGEKYVTEKTVEYSNTGFLYVNDSAHALTIVTDEETNEQVLKFTETGATDTIWNGVRSNYIAYDGNKDGGYVGKGVKYIVMDVKLSNATGIMVSYEDQDSDTEYKVWRNLTTDSYSDIIDDKGVQGKVVLDEWITIKIPLSQKYESAKWRNFYVRPRGNNGIMYIRNVQYCTDEYVAPLNDLTLTLHDETIVDYIQITSTSIDTNTQPYKVATIIANGDETTAKTQVLDGNWFEISNIINELKIGENKLTVRVMNGSSVAEKTITYNNMGYLYVIEQPSASNADVQHSLSIVDDPLNPDSGEKVLKFTETGANITESRPDNGIRSKYIAYGDSNNGNYTQGKYIVNGVKYITMEVYLADATGLRISHADPNSDQEYYLWENLYSGDSSEFVDDNGVQGTLKANEWVTIKIPLSPKTYEGATWRQFYVRPLNWNETMYVRNVRYCDDVYVKPIERLNVSIDEQSEKDYLVVNTSATGTASVIANGDETRVWEFDLSTKDTDGNVKYDLTEIMNQLKIGDNEITVRVPNGTSTAQATIIYKNIGYLYARDGYGTAEIVSLDGEQVVKFSGATDQWDGIRSKYVALNDGGDGHPGEFYSDGITYVTMKVKLTDATGMYVYFHADEDNSPASGKVVQLINVGDTNELLLDENGTGGSERLRLNRWVTLKVPFVADKTGAFRKFYITTRGGENAALYIKDVQYGPVAEEPATVQSGPDFQ